MVYEFSVASFLLEEAKVSRIPLIIWTQNVAQAKFCIRQFLSIYVNLVFMDSTTLIWLNVAFGNCIYAILYKSPARTPADAGISLMRVLGQIPILVPPWDPSSTPRWHIGCYYWYWGISLARWPLQQGWTFSQILTWLATDSPLIVICLEISVLPPLEQTLDTEMNWLILSSCSNPFLERHKQHKFAHRVLVHMPLLESQWILFVLLDYQKASWCSVKKVDVASSLLWTKGS